MKICFLVDDYSFVGGIQRVVSLVSSALTETNDVHVVSMYQENGKTNLKAYSQKVSLATLIYGKKKYVQQALRVVKLLRKYIIKNEIDILIATSEMLSPYSFLATKMTKTSFVCWTHTPAFNNVEAKLQAVFKKLGVKKAAYTVCLLDQTKEELSKEYNTNHIVVIPNPIDPVLMKDINYNPDTKKIISVGRICYQKYYEKLVDVASIVLKKHPDWIWDIYGDGDNRANIEELINEQQLNGKLILKGNANNIYELYKEYSIQVITSRFEGFPMTLLEGIANGIPLVGFDIAGVNALIKNDENGFLAKPYDEFEMAEKINYLIDNQDLMVKFSNNCIQKRNSFSVDDVVIKWNELFEKISKR